MLYSVRGRRRLAATRASGFLMLRLALGGLVMLREGHENGARVAEWFKGYKEMYFNIFL